MSHFERELGKLISKLPCGTCGKPIGDAPYRAHRWKQYHATPECEPHKEKNRCLV